MYRSFILTAIFLGGFTTTAMALGPAETVVEAEQILNEQMAIPARQIPRQLLSEAQGIVIVPNVIKIGFIGGARRGHGVVLVRDVEGEWSLPQFVTLTGGSVGFQAGIQGADVVLVFTTRKSVEHLMRGEFTIGVDASAAAGPVGRDAAVGTDATLRSEIYSYSRSRGLFLGVALDGSALEIDNEAHDYFYGTSSGKIPARVPKAADDLRHLLAEFSPHSVVEPGTSEPKPPANSNRIIEGLRRSVYQNAGQLHAQLSPEWRHYLALPKELQTPGTIPPADSLSQVIKRYARINNSGEYQQLAKLPSFQRTYEVLIEYEKAISKSHPLLDLPAPPTQ